jgi:dihydroorotate dehydrogenase
VSGVLLRERSRAVFQAVASELFGEVPLIAVGGIDSGDEAWSRIRAGASLVQLYSALVFEGPLLVQRMNRRLVERLDEAGLESLADAVGSARAA